MLYHTLFFRFKPGVTEANLADFDASFRRFEEIPGVKQVVIGPNIAPEQTRQFSDGHSRAAIVVLESPEHFDDYVNHPIHKEGEDVGMWMLEGMTIVDIEA
jgi:hypothetical protein